MGETGALLIKHGFVKAHSDYNMSYSHGEPAMYYREFPYSDDMRSNLQKYVSLFEQYVEANKTLVQAKRDKTQHQANKLWDSN